MMENINKIANFKLTCIIFLMVYYLKVKHIEHRERVYIYERIKKLKEYTSRNLKTQNIFQK